MKNKRKIEGLVEETIYLACLNAQLELFCQKTETLGGFKVNKYIPSNYSLSLKITAKFDQEGNFLELKNVKIKDQGIEMIFRLLHSIAKGNAKQAAQIYNGFEIYSRTKDRKYELPWNPKLTIRTNDNRSFYQYIGDKIDEYDDKFAEEFKEELHKLKVAQKDVIVV